MRIAIAYRRLGRGAAVPQYCLHLAQGLIPKDEVWVVARDLDAPSLGARHVRLPFSFRSRRLEYALNTSIYSALLRATRLTKGIDVVHTQDGELVGGDVVTAHSLLRVVYRTFRSSDPEYVSWIPRSPLLWCEDLIYGGRRYRRVIVSSEKMRRALRDVYRVPEDQTALVRLGVDTDLFQPDSARREEFRRVHGISPDAPVLLHVSTDFERKGLRAILGALGRLPREYVLVVAGRGHEGTFRDYARKMGLLHRIIYLGFQENLEKTYPAADVFVFPTRLDFFGLPVLEAMACGVPPIVTANAGVAELVQDGRNGFLLDDPANADEIAARIEAARNHRTAGREARATASECSVPRMVEGTRRVYEERLRR